MDHLTAKERQDALSVIFEEAPHLSGVQAATFLDAAIALARRLHRYYEIECSAPMSDIQRRNMDRCERELRATFAGAGLGLYLNSDPRGNPVGILTPRSGRYNTMGGRECGWRL